jgi:predicted molibdopterin-dependent oxidoreductase YjgC
MPDWAILGRIARRTGADGFDFESDEEIRNEISSLVGRFSDVEASGREAAPLDFGTALMASGAKRPRAVNGSEEFPFVLDVSVAEHTYRGFSLSSWVAGAVDLFPEGTLLIHPDDAGAAGISRDDEVLVTAAGFETTLTAVVAGEQPSGTLHAVVPPGGGGTPRRVAVSIRKRNV